MSKLIMFAIFEQLKKCDELRDCLEDVDSQQDPDLCEQHGLILKFLGIETTYLNIFSLAVNSL
jgi:hypothetical protein